MFYFAVRAILVSFILENAKRKKEALVSKYFTLKTCDKKNTEPGILKLV